MLACRIHAKDDLRVEHTEMPEAGPGEVLLKLGAGGICGSDLHYYFEGKNGSFVVREPLIPGHEASAVVARVGAGVTRVRAGDKVAVSPSHACGRCDYCREGREQLCANMKFLGSASLFPHVQGMFREYFVMGERQCYPVDGDVTRVELVFAAPLAVGVPVVKRGGVVVQVGTLPHEPLPFVVNDVMAKEIDLRGAFRWGIEFDWAVAYLSTRRVDVRPLLSGQYPLQDAVAAFQLAADKNRSTK